ncbi:MULTISPECIES: sensor domain-containing diguanylate cyclase [Pacificimonas]|nr:MULTISPECIES: sensor domain-containing diguanylate cyclase [Pacificimonas]MBZ6377933.1 diguanylate cyclase [Pacificimonas aurantium]
MGPPASPNNSAFVRAAIGFAVYFGLSAATLALSRVNGGLAIVWLTNGVVVAALLTLPARERWMHVGAAFIAICIASALFGIHPTVSALLAPLAPLECVLTAELLRRLRPRMDFLETVGGVVVFTFVAGVLVPSAIAVPAAFVTVPFTDQPFFDSWFRWAAGHGLGTLIVMPLAIMLWRGEVADWFRTSTRREYVDALVAFVALSLFALLVFLQPFPLLFVAVLPMVFATLVAGRVGASVALVIVAAIGTTTTLIGVGPIAALGVSSPIQVHVLQLFLAVTFLTALPVSAALKTVRSLLRRAEENESHFRMMASHSADGTLRLSESGRVTYASPAMGNLTGIESDRMLGRSFLLFFPRKDRGRAKSAMTSALRAPGRDVSLEQAFDRADGERIYLEMIARAVEHKDGGKTLVGSIRDISDHREAQQMLSKLVQTDPLTQIPNRRAFTEKMGQLLQNLPATSPATLALFDLDHFKQINDRHGHASGDEVLKTVAATVTLQKRSGDLLARIGGEEFALILTGAGLEEAARVCDRVRRKLHGLDILDEDGVPISVSASFGLRQLCRGDNQDTVLRAADEALYAAKAAGRNRVYCAEMPFDVPRKSSGAA